MVLVEMLVVCIFLSESVMIPELTSMLGITCPVGYLASTSPAQMRHVCVPGFLQY